MSERVERNRQREVPPEGCLQVADDSRRVDDVWEACRQPLWISEEAVASAKLYPIRARQVARLSRIPFSVACPTAPVLGPNRRVLLLSIISTRVDRRTPGGMAMATYSDEPASVHVHREVRSDCPSGFDRRPASVQDFLRKRPIIDRSRQNHCADQCGVRADGLPSSCGFRCAPNQLRQ